jgi:leucyl aminopeptidase (aminopeptidase T)
MTRFVAAAALGLVATLAPASSAGRPPQGGMDAEKETLAQKLVANAAVKEGDIVLVTGGARDVELLEDIAVNARRMGAFPLIAIGSDRMTRRMFDDVPGKYDSQLDKLGMKINEMVDVVISVDFGETDGLLAHVPPERLAARAKADAPVAELLRKRGVRTVNLGNGMYPNAALANRWGVPPEQLVKVFWGGVNVDYDKLRATGASVKTAFESGREVHITNPNGTDLRVRVEKRPVFVSDGSISDEDLKGESAARQVWLPAGEVFLAPVPGTAEGTVVVDRHFYQGAWIEGLTLRFKGGKLVSMSAKSGIEAFKKAYELAGAGKEEFAFVDLGINPNVQIAPGSRMTTWVPAGMVTVGLGNNAWAGGANNVGYTEATFLPGSTVTVDGKVVVENGALKQP